MFDWLRRRKKTPEGKPEGEFPATMVWGVLQGPILARDIPDCHMPEGAAMMVMKISRGKEVFDAEFWFNNFEEAYSLEKYFKDSFFPIELTNLKEP